MSQINNAKYSLPQNTTNFILLFLTITTITLEIDFIKHKVNTLQQQEAKRQNNNTKTLFFGEAVTPLSINYFWVGSVA